MGYVSSLEGIPYVILYLVETSENHSREYIAAGITLVEIQQNRHVHSWCLAVTVFGTLRRVCRTQQCSSRKCLKLEQVGGWTNPFEKYARQNGSWNPKDRGEHNKYLSCHHLENPLDIRRTLSGLLTLLQHLPSTKPWYYMYPQGIKLGSYSRKNTHSIHVWYIYLHLVEIFMVNISCMDAMG